VCCAGCTRVFLSVPHPRARSRVVKNYLRRETSFDRERKKIKRADFEVEDGAVCRSHESLCRRFGRVAAWLRRKGSIWPDRCWSSFTFRHGFLYGFISTWVPNRADGAFYGPSFGLFRWRQDACFHGGPARGGSVRETAPLAVSRASSRTARKFSGTLEFSTSSGYFCHILRAIFRSVANSSISILNSESTPSGGRDEKRLVAPGMPEHLPDQQRPGGHSGPSAGFWRN
jgi:hypothetical protein